jgi:Fic family protein
MVAWRYLELIPFGELDHHCIKKLQKIITLPQTDLQPDQRGYYRDLSKITPYIRDLQNGDIKRVTPPWSMVQGLMDNWLLDYQESDAITMHIRFEKVHPFVDGNGRVGRMLMWWMQMHQGVPLTVILEKNKEEYYRWFR